MSKRLQVLIPEKEFVNLRRKAKREGVSVGEFVRRAIRAARPARDTDREIARKLRVLDEAVKHSFPTCDIEQMNAEIEQGYLSDLP